MTCLALKYSTCQFHLFLLPNLPSVGAHVPLPPHSFYTERARTFAFICRSALPYTQMESFAPPFPSSELPHSRLWLTAASPKHPSHRIGSSACRRTLLPFLGFFEALHLPKTFLDPNHFAPSHWIYPWHQLPRLSVSEVRTFVILKTLPFSRVRICYRFPFRNLINHPE